VLPLPALAAPAQVRNAACAIAALRALDGDVGVDAHAAGVANARLPGRLQHFTRGGVEVVVDVAHNPQAARALAAWLRSRPPRRTLAVYGALADKDAVGVVEALAGQVDAWHLAGLADAGPRGGSAEALAARLAGSAAGAGARHRDVESALAAAIAQAAPDARVLAFGAFHVAAGALRALQARG
jgi:dihydrofolate synthase/folylpolyglutamate synthase